MGEKDEITGPSCRNISYWMRNVYPSGNFEFDMKKDGLI
jgi:hypothetical protein